MGEGGVIAAYFSDILIICSISLIEMVTSSTLFSTSLSLEIPSSFRVYIYIVSRDTPAPFLSRS